MEILRPVLVLFTYCGLLFFTAYIFRFTLKSERRLAILQAFVFLGSLAWFITELLSLFKAVSFITLAISWGIVCLTTLAIIIKISSWNAILADIREVRRCLMSLPVGLLMVLGYISFIVLVLGLIAFCAVPATWDSMTYHLSRVMHWEQNQSLAFYPTSINRQLHLGPLAEILILHFQILAGNDHLANFVQFFAMLGCIVGVTFIAKMLGGNIYAQVFSPMVAITLPMGILQSTSTQNDYVVSLWLVCFVSLALKQLQAEKPSCFLSLLAGVSMGLAILTKVTVLMFGASFGLWLAIGLMTRFHAKAWKHLAILLCTALIIVAPHGLRNYRLYHNPLGPMTESKSGEYQYTNVSYGFSVISSNILRNAAIHLASPFENINQTTEKTISWVHAILKIDINARATTWGGTKFRVAYSKGEDLAGNPLHLLVIIISVVFLANQKKPQLVVIFLCLTSGIFLFSWFLKWQPWHSRLHLPLFVLAAPFVGCVFSISLRRSWLYVVVLVLSFTSLSYLFLNPTRPLIGKNSVLITSRLDQYFLVSSNFKAYYQQSRAIYELECSDVGLMTNIDDWEYPLWVMTKAHGQDIHFEHILVDNPSATLEVEFSPCAILVTYPLDDQKIIYQNKVFVLVNKVYPLSLLALSSAQ